MKFSPTAICITVLLHCVLYLSATTNFFHHDARKSPYVIVSVALPITTPNILRPHEENTPDLSELIATPESLINTEDTEPPIDEDRYYLPQELSQPVHVLQDDTAGLTTPIRQVVVMALYINEGGTVDDVVIERKGLLTDEEEGELKSAFKTLIFLPGMRGEKVVKALYRIQLEINRKIIIHR
ncbi:hypothetical protein [Solimicrobium silvestre]|uniref:Gram-negative bacterial tonB protein n=1 Tax=Solimicrobium silvestre TaxID=2099400 RepID=A0A2S9H5N0_9BURK|nr:hypothetical protein [Solimicrobium silvestre]PRC95258.1 hypothetical protein S2091_0453 [Solimicrobium silvestre]